MFSPTLHEIFLHAFAFLHVNNTQTATISTSSIFTTLECLRGVINNNKNKNNDFSGVIINYYDCELFCSLIANKPWS